MGISIFKLSLFGILALACTASRAAENLDEITVLHCKDVRKLILKSNGQHELRDNAYRIEVGLSFAPEKSVEFFNWGYFPHTETDWGQSANSHKENLQYVPGLFKVTKFDRDTIEIKRVAKSLTNPEQLWVQTFMANRKNGEYRYSSTIQDSQGRFIKFDGVEGVASNEGFCEVEKRAANLF